MKHEKVHTPQYVSFDQKTGEVFCIGPTIQEGYQYIEVSDEQIEPIKTFKDKMTDYKVVYNKKERMFKLKKLVVIEEDITYQKIEKYQNEEMDFDVLLNIDKNKKSCYIDTSEELLDIMQKTNVEHKNITFSFTKKDDPHILYDMVTFEINKNSKQSIKIPKQYDVYSNSDMAKCMYGEVK
tara:strand:- start:35511 stop:36053 length:543 start_codon:yes stop_codon:yes gene_type:complete